MELQALNKRFLQLARDAARNDKAMACQIFGMDQSIADRIESMTDEEIDQASQTQVLIFRMKTA